MNGGFFNSTSEKHPDPNYDIHEIKAEEGNAESEMASTIKRVRAFDVVRYFVRSHQQDNDSEPGEEMERKLKNLARIEYDKSEPFQKSNPSQDHQNRSHPPVTLYHLKKRGRACLSGSPDPESDLSLIQEEQHHDRVIDAVRRPKISKQMFVDQRIMHG